MDIRENTISCISEYISEEKATIVEKSIYNWAIDHAEKYSITKKWINQEFLELYINKVRNILENLNPTGYVQNDELQIKLENMSIPELIEYDIAKQPITTLFKERWKDVIKQEIGQEFKTYEEKIAGSSEFRCKKCGARNCHIEQAQTRSADESSTLFVTCKECGNMMKFG